MKKLILVLGLLVAHGLAAQPFDGMRDAIEEGDFGNLKAVIISQYGEVLFEDYFRGTRQSDLHQVQSVTKSIGSALVGIAHRQGKIQIDQDMNHFFGSLYPMSQGDFNGKGAITVEQVLQQRHGIEWDEESTDYRHPDNSAGMMLGSNDWYEYFLTRPMDAAPGTKFTYSSGASTLMSRLIRVSTGMGPDEFANQALFGPLGFAPVHWEIYSEGGMGTGQTEWENPDQDPTLGFSLWLRARDMLKFGELYLNGGIHNGQRILDQSWVERSWTKSSHSGNSDYFPEEGWGHGYQWWIAKITDTLDREWNVFFASGWGSQVIFVVPELGLVMVTTADNYDHNGLDVDALLYAYVLPNLKPRLDSWFNGSWFNPQTDRQGFTMEVLESFNIPLAYWYTYDLDGNQRWFIAQGNIVDGVGEVIIYQTSGGVFLQPDPVDAIEWGSGRFIPIDCNHMSFEFSSDVEAVADTVPLTRLTGNCFTAPGDG